MTDSKPAGGRLKGAKSPSYVRATSTPESRASPFTARSMLVSDVAYVLSAAELGFTPAESAHKLIPALLELLLHAIGSTPASRPATSWRSARPGWRSAPAEHTAWLHLGRNRGKPAELPAQTILPAAAA